MKTRVADRRVVHLSDSADDSQLLRLELDSPSAAFAVTRVQDAKALQRELDAAPVDLIVADLPLPWERAHDDLAEVQRTRPEIEVLFRWGDSGARSSEPEDEQLSRLVEQRLELRPTRKQDEAERRAIMRELARRQDVLLRIQRQPMWDFDCVLRDTAHAIAEMLDVERVSVWEFSPDRSSLVCAVLHLRSTNTYQSGDTITSHPRYFRALESSLSIAAHDSLHDPRTSEFADDYLEPLGIPSMLDAPIRLDGAVVGVLCIEHVGDARHWSVLDQCAASTLACHLARAFEVRRRREAEQRANALERLDALGQIAGQIAHDFNNHLTVLRGWVGLLELDVAADSAAGHAVRELGAELTRAKTQVRELLALGRSEASKAGSADLNQVLRRSSQAMRRVLGEQIELEIAAPDEPVEVRIDAHRLESILLNLSSNSRDATEGHGRVRVGIETSGAARGAVESVRLVFEDDGPGFTPEALERLFQPLFTTKGPARGSGLGMASIQRAVLDVGGQVRVANRKPRGARIEIELPRVG